MSETIKDLSDDLGEEVSEVKLEVNYQIIEHFSDNLYGSPNKAVEELVANGFDAFAEEVDVYIPGEFTSDKILVWDDGESMDVEGLQKLWWIADSPRTNGDRIREKNGDRRKMIGKFGIGKLASYSVGRLMSHLCRHGSEFHLVSVDYDSLSQGSGGSRMVSEETVDSPILQLEEHEARSLAESLFDTVPEKFDDKFQRESWTLAVVEGLKIEDLPQGRLMWVLGNGMPLRPDFTIRVNENEVESRLKEEAAIEWNLGTDEVLESVEEHWEEAVKEDHFDEIQDIGEEPGLDPSQNQEDNGKPVPYIKFAKLGKVWGTIRLFDESLLKWRTKEHGRSHGFFVYVRGRLLNQDEDEADFLLDPPSYGALYRSQFILHADGLDEELLADRSRLKESEATRELARLHKALYLAARSRIEARDEEKAEQQSTRSVLPVHSRSYYRSPLNTLLMSSSYDEEVAFDPARPSVERKPLGEKHRMSALAPAQGGFQVNTMHPFFKKIEERLGKSKARREALRALDLMAVSERLLEGHLRTVGFSEDEVREIVGWTDGLFRQLARGYDAAADPIQKMYRTSYPGHDAFEEAVHQVFVDMGFEAEHRGEQGEEDILVVGTVGPESYSFTVEPKGSKGAVDPETARVSNVNGHRDAVDADFAILVAREFVGFVDDPDNESATILNECKVQGERRVSLMQLEAIEELYEAVHRFGYPLPTLREVLSRVETPASKLETIKSMANPTEGFDYSRLLEEIWARQGSEAAGDTVPYKAVYQQGPWNDEMDFDDFDRHVIALDTLATGHISVMEQNREIYLRQSPEKILEAIDRRLRGEGYELAGPNTEDDEGT